MSEPLTLAPGEYGNIGAVMCCVTYQGQVSVAGDVSRLDDGETTEFARGHIQARRDGESFVFSLIEQAD
tara:strand:+ start:4193 stop:4399 length:207 start_codon:yes stop_codon:yes gene_type:complete